MEPSEFNERLESLIEEAVRDGLDPAHIVNITEANREEVAVDLDELREIAQANRGDES